MLTRGYYKVTLGRSEFCVDVRYCNLRPIGKGAYGLVASADDLITGRKVSGLRGGCGGRAPIDTPTHQ